MIAARYWNGKTYHFAHNSIQCGADREGCEIFEVDLGAGKLRILALTEKDAEEAYREECQCPDCGGIVTCWCDEDDED
jgi:hypothetical protein